MADREMIAATLAAALLSGRDSGPHSDPGGHAVMVYHQVLNALEEAGSLPPRRPTPSRTP